jgi:protease secretion system membrane fusion protein
MNANRKKLNFNSSVIDVNELKSINEVDDYLDTRSIIRLGFWVLIIGFGAFLLWAVLAPLDEGVSTAATVVVANRHNTIQHMSGGIVRRVSVKEGQWVGRDDTLIELEDVWAKSNYESIHENYLSQLATESRLISEQRGLDQIQFLPELIKVRNEPLARIAMDNQAQLFRARRSSYKAQVGGMAQMIESRKKQLDLQTQQLQSVKELANEGYAPKNQVLQLEQNQAELRTSLTDIQTNYQRVQQDYLKEVSSQLTDVRREVQAGKDKLEQVAKELQLTQIKSPVSGQVVGLTINAIGGVVQPAQHLMDIVPKDESLLIDAKVPPHVIDKVRKGDEVDVHFTTFANSPQLVVKAQLLSLSSDVISEQTPQGMQSYYLARIQITPQGLKALGQRVVQPGMPAEVLLKTGERSFLTYLLHPLIKRMAASLKEE